MHSVACAEFVGSSVCGQADVTIAAPVPVQVYLGDGGVPDAATSSGRVGVSDGNAIVIHSGHDELQLPSWRRYPAARRPGLASTRGLWPSPPSQYWSAPIEAVPRKRAGPANLSAGWAANI